MEKNSQIKTRQMPSMKQIAKFSSRQYFPLYGIINIGIPKYCSAISHTQSVRLGPCMYWLYKSTEVQTSLRGRGFVPKSNLLNMLFI